MKSLEGKQVLIVDDSPEMLGVVENILNQLGVSRVDNASSGEQALKLINILGSRYDVVICDQHMDGMKGIDVLKEIRKQFTKEKLPFVMLTSDGTRENIMMLVSSGGNNFIVKPPSLEVIEEKLNSVLK